MCIYLWLKWDAKLYTYEFPIGPKIDIKSLDGKFGNGNK